MSTPGLELYVAIGGDRYVAHSEAALDTVCNGRRVWDVYDRDQQRALRLSGEEPAGKAGRDAWAAADDLILRKIAQAGLAGLSGMINGPAPVEAPPLAPALRGPAMVSAPAPVSQGFTVSALGSDSALGYSRR